MKPESFTKWLADMKSAGLSRFDADAARLLGVSHDTVARYKRNGAPIYIALACRALLHRMEPYE